MRLDLKLSYITTASFAARLPGQLAEVVDPLVDPSLSFGATTEAIRRSK